MAPLAQGEGAGFPSGIPSGVLTGPPPGISAGATPPPFIESLLQSASRAAAKSVASATTASSAAITSIHQTSQSAQATLTSSSATSSTVSLAAVPSDISGTTPFNLSIPNPLPPNHTLGPALLAISWTLRGLVLLVIILRLWAKLRPTIRFGWDDATMIMATIFAVFVEGPIITVQVAHGVGRHWYYLPITGMSLGKELQAFYMIFSSLSLFFMRTSVCLFVMRLAPRTLKWPKYFIWLALIVNFFASLANLLGTFLQCRPFDTVWKSVGSDKCYAVSVIQHVLLATSIAGIIADFLTVGVSVTLIWTLQMTPRKKAGLIVLLSLGLVTAIASILKTVEGVAITVHDPSYDVAVFEIYATFEECLGIIVASIPALPMLFNRLLNKYKSSRQSPTNTSSGSNSKMLKLIRSFKKGKPSKPSTGISSSGAQEASNQSSGPNGLTEKKDQVFVQVHEAKDSASSISPISPAFRQGQNHPRQPTNHDLMITLHGTNATTFYDNDDQDDIWVHRYQRT